MSKNPLATGLLVAAILGGIQHASAQTTEHDATKIKRLEATIEQLTLQLAKTVEERNRLRDALSREFVHQYGEGRNALGCDIVAAQDFARNHAYREGIALGLWLEENGKGQDCTRNQLESFTETFDIRPDDVARKILEDEISTR